MIGAAISLVQLMRRTSRPHVAVLGRIPGTRRFSDMDRHPDNEATPGALIFRPESSLVYFNIEHVCMTILDRVRQEPVIPHLVVLDLSAAPYVDLQSAHALVGLADELGKAGSSLQVVEARAGVRDRLHVEGLDARLGGINRFMSVADDPGQAIDGLGGNATRFVAYFPVYSSRRGEQSTFGVGEAKPVR
jgi:sulfate permease, SulP family